MQNMAVLLSIGDRNQNSRSLRFLEDVEQSSGVEGAKQNKAHKFVWEWHEIFAKY